MTSVHPDDRAEVAYLFRNHVTRDGKNHVTIRKTTVRGNLIWVCIHYAFMEERGVQYAYCTYFDVSELKEGQQQTFAMYQELNKELDAHLSKPVEPERLFETLGALIYTPTE